MRLLPALFSALVMTLGCLSLAQAEKRVTPVNGNSAYKPVPSPSNRSSIGAVHLVQLESAAGIWAGTGDSFSLEFVIDKAGEIDGQIVLDAPEAGLFTFSGKVDKNKRVNITFSEGIDMGNTVDISIKGNFRHPTVDVQLFDIYRSRVKMKKVR